MKLWSRIINKNTYISVLIILLGNMFLSSTVEKLIIKYIHLTQPAWALSLISGFIITLVLFLVVLEVFEI